MRKTALLAMLALTLALPSCGDDSPTQPDTPTLNPAQLTVQISVNQATATTNISATGPAKQTRSVNTTVTVSNCGGCSEAELEDLRIFGNIVAGTDAYPFSQNSTPPPPNDSVAGGETVTIDTQVDVEIRPPFQVNDPFDVSAELRFFDGLGNSGTTPPVSTPVNPSQTVRPAGSCAQGPGVDCLTIGSPGRFRVEVTWADAPNMTPQPATLGQQFNDGAFWFFAPENYELLVQVIDNCQFNNHWWVFLSATTNVEVNITVEDTANNVTKQYRNPLGTAFQPLQDTNAFATCPGPVPVP